MNNFELITTFYTGDVLDVLAAKPEYFKEELWRQLSRGSAHQDVETAFIRYPVVTSAWDVFESKEIADRALYAEPCVKKKITDLATLLKRQPARAMIAKLLPGGKIAEHIDEGSYSADTERYHIVLSTNAKCFLKSGDEEIHLPKGSCYWFNKHVLHSARNEGNTPRYHMIIDYWR